MPMSKADRDDLRSMISNPNAECAIVVIAAPGDDNHSLSVGVTVRGELTPFDMRRAIGALLSDLAKYEQITPEQFANAALATLVISRSSVPRSHTH